MINLIKNIFGDISILYKNFFHFNFSKIINILITIFYTIVLVTPFIVLINFFSDYIVATWNTWNLYKSIFTFMQVLIIFMAISSVFYFFTLQSKVNLEYIKWNRLWFLKNNYFNLKLLWNHFKLVFFYGIIFAILFFIFSLIFTTFIWLADTSNLDDLSNWFAISSTILLILFIIFFFCILCKMLLSLIIMIDESEWKNFNSSLYYIKKSFKLFKWLSVKINLLIISIILFLLSLLVIIPLLNSVYTSNTLQDYLVYQSNPEYALQITSDSDQFYYFEHLKSAYSWYSSEKLISEFQNSQIKKYIFLALYFLLIIGLFEMMLVSFYKRKLLKEKTKKIISEDNKKEEIKKVIKKKVVKKIPTKKIPVKKTTKKTPVKKTTKKTPVKKTTKKVTPKK